MWFSFLVQALSGCLVAFSQPALHPWFGSLAACLGFALHWHFIEKLSNRIVRRLSFFWFFFVQLVQLSWMTAIHYQGIGFIFLYVALSAGISWQFSFFTKQIRRRKELDFLTVFSFAAFWVVLEWSRLFVFCGFAFNFVGLSLTCSLFSLQSASLFGVLGLSFLVMLTNLVGLKVLRKESSWKVWICLAAFPYLYGAAHLSYHDYQRQREVRGEYRALLVQSGLSPAEKYRLPGREKEFVDPWKQWSFIINELKKQESRLFDLIILPEAALPFGFEEKLYSKERVQKELVFLWGDSVREALPYSDEKFVSNGYWFQALANFLQKEIAVGLDARHKEKNYNAVFCFQPGQSSPLRYEKRILLPIAESLPFQGIQFFSKLYGIEEFFTPGREARVLGSYLFSPSICYEELFSSPIREGRIKGANLFINFSNDGWFPSSSLSEQHFRHGLIRAVENGVPLFRACNIGVTGCVDSLGRVVARLGENGESQFVSGSICVSVSDYNYKTLFTILGDGPFVLLCFLSIFFCLIKEYRLRSVFGCVENRA